MKTITAFCTRRTICSIAVMFTFAGISTVCAAEDYSYRTPAPDEWMITTTPQASSGTFSSTALKNSITSLGFSSDFQYLERGGISLGATSTSIKFKNAATADISQTAYNLSGRMNCTPDTLSGILTLRADLSRVSNNDTTNETNGVSVIAPQVSFLNYAKTYYLDLGYARSTYGDSTIGNGSLTVTQWTPTVGFGFNDGAEWVQLRSYNVQVSNAVRANNNSATSAIDAKWTHYFAGADGFLPEQLILGALVGKRAYGVDGSNIYNLADVQTGGQSLAAQWLLATDTHLYVQAGQDNYDASSAGVAFSYSSTYYYLGITNHW